ncbi:MobA/MobL family protein [Stenotrophomonas acidaminiphila]|uniref:MobA/MobL family protein n=1 Tax=Stenotrophomonas acidaminiphila TaxID=128780 RepID=UPI002405B8E6|nr:MobA/MobL family protein [Stenotrophomonas acidaminiphila]
MAIYHLTVNVYSRRDGDSSTAAAAYRAGVCIEDALTGEVHDYTKRHGVAFSALCLPGDQTADRAEFWNRVEGHHKRGDAVTCREVVVALPAELDSDARQDLAHAFAKHLADTYGIAADLAIHEPSKGGDNRNHHAHILLSACAVSPNGTLGKKAEALDPIACKRAKHATLADTQREHWAGMVNAALAQAGLGERVDHRRLEDQKADALKRGDFSAVAQLDRTPTKHEGKAVTQARRRGERLPRAKRNDTLKAAGERRFNQHTRRFEDLKAKAAAEGRLQSVDEQALHARALLERRKESARSLQAAAGAEVQAIDQAQARRAAVQARAKKPHKAGASKPRPAANAAGHQGKVSAAVERAARSRDRVQQETVVMQEAAKQLEAMIEEMLARARRALQQPEATPWQRATARTLLETHDAAREAREAHRRAAEARTQARATVRRARADRGHHGPPATDPVSVLRRALGRPTAHDRQALEAAEAVKRAKAAEAEAKAEREQADKLRQQATAAAEKARTQFAQAFDMPAPRYDAKPELQPEPTTTLAPTGEPTTSKPRGPAPR